MVHLSCALPITLPPACILIEIQLSELIKSPQEPIALPSHLHSTTLLLKHHLLCPTHMHCTCSLIIFHPALSLSWSVYKYNFHQKLPWWFSRGDIFPDHEMGLKAPLCTRCGAKPITLPPACTLFEIRLLGQLANSWQHLTETLQILSNSFSYFL